MLDSKAVGNKINKLRTDNNYSQDKMAEKLFVTRQAISKWELGQSLPSIDSLLQMCQIFKVSFEEILCLDEKIDDIDPNDIFKGHSREYIIQNIIDRKIRLDIPEIMYQLSPAERMMIIQAVNNKKLKVDHSSLLAHLSSEERAFLVKRKEN